ncbi:MAG: YciI family protein [Gammaproteobacteria bacterium]|nr:YciI family protein [Gammaproteobacteria bacterium]
MWYVILGEDTPNSLAQRQASRPAHLARLQTLRDAGRLMVAGPFPALDSPEPGPAGFSGSLIIAEFPCLSEAERWAQADPYIITGVYARVTVKPFKKVLP